MHAITGQHTLSLQDLETEVKTISYCLCGNDMQFNSLAMPGWCLSLSYRNCPPLSYALHSLYDSRIPLANSQVHLCQSVSECLCDWSGHFCQHSQSCLMFCVLNSLVYSLVLHPVPDTFISSSDYKFFQHIVLVLQVTVSLLSPQHFFTRHCLKAEGRAPSMQPLDSFPSWSLHCTVRLCQPVSQVLEQVIQVPVTHWGPGVGVGVEGLGGVGEPGMRTGVAEEDLVVLLLVVVVVVLVVVVAVLSKGCDFGLGMSGATSCCGVVRRGMKKL